MGLHVPPVQTATGYSITSLTGGDFGPGTRGMLGLTINFSSPLTEGNTVAIAVQGVVNQAGCHVTFGPELAFVGFSGSHSGLFTNYWFAVTYTDAAGTETMAGPIGTYSTDQVSVNFSNPNPNNNVHPGWVTWNIYGSNVDPTSLKLLQSGLAPTAGWSAPLSGLTFGGPNPPQSPIRDSLGIAFEQSDFIEQTAGGSNFGLNAMGIYIGIVPPGGGAEAIKFVCGAFNANPFFTLDGVLSIVAAEITGTPGSNLSKNSLQQGSSLGVVALNTVDSLMVTDKTDWTTALGGVPTYSGHVAMVVDQSPSAGIDNLFAALANFGEPPAATDPPTPILTPGSHVYHFIDSVAPVAPNDGVKLWFWYAIIEVLTLRCPSSSATAGVPYSSSFVATGGTPPYTFAIISGSLPPGLSLNTSTGAVTGTPTSGGTFAYTGQVTDNVAATATASCTITVVVNLSLACPSSSATLNVPYSSSFVATGGTAPYTFSISAGALPPGLHLNSSTGAVTGTPTVPGTFAYTGRVVDHFGNPATTHCSITIGASPIPPPPLGGIHTLRFEIPQKRWFPHNYSPVVTFHYLDEPESTKPNDQQLLLLSGTEIYKSGGNTDSGTDIQSIIQLPSYDGGDERAQKLYVDAMSEADQAGDISSQIQFNNQQIAGPLLALTPSGPRQQFLENIASLSDLSLYRNISVRYGFTGGPDGPRLFAFEPSGYAQPYVSTSIVTQYINLAFPGWKHHRRLYAGLISLADVIFTIKTQDGRTYGPITIPSTAGQFRIIPLMIPHGCKDLAFAYQLDGQGTAFALFPDAFTIETKDWVQPSYLELAIWNT